jgi:hypothetical protein
VDSVPGAHDAAAADSGRSDTKVAHGRFFTMVSPFGSAPFASWLDLVPADALFVEPFAGANNLVRMVSQVRAGLEWSSFDIEPQHRDVEARDTLSDFPTFDRPVAVVTNPPYLAKNVARRRGMTGAAERCGRYDNLYLACLARCLEHARWVAAIVPESFAGSGEFRDRLIDVVVADRQLFTDTEVPVCLALWGEHPRSDFSVWRGRRRLGCWGELWAKWPGPSPGGGRLRFNDPDGAIGLVAVDSPAGATIRFCDPGGIERSEVQNSSRHRTRISVADLDSHHYAQVIDAANERLGELRKATGDVGLTSFMGFRRDGEYRRRLDYTVARNLLGSVLDELGV